MTHRSTPLLLSLLFLAAPLHGKDARKDAYNVILISVDALRADHLGCYGYSRGTSRRIDELARRGVLFETAISQAPWTLPSFASLFTSKYLHQHGASHSGLKLEERENSLAEILRDSGYRTAAFVSGFFLRPKFGLDQGFESYVSDESSSLRETLPRILDWLKTNRRDPFFLFIHTNEVHAPYQTPPPFHHKFDGAYKGIVDRMALDSRFFFAYNLAYSSRTWKKEFGPAPDKDLLSAAEEIRKDPRNTAHMVAHYDAGIAYTDHLLGALWDRLEELELFRNSIVILTSDHGEELGERGRFGHGASLYETVIRVPLIIRHPRWKGGRRITAPVQLIDVAPTLLESLRIPAPPGFRGSSMAGLVERNKRGGERHVFSCRAQAFGKKRLRSCSVRTSRWKLIHYYGDRRDELYDIKKDPQEMKNLIERRPRLARNLLNKLLRHRADSDPGAESSKMTLSPKLREELREAGYVR